MFHSHTLYPSNSPFSLYYIIWVTRIALIYTAVVPRILQESCVVKLNPDAGWIFALISLTYYILYFVYFCLILYHNFCGLVSYIDNIFAEVKLILLFVQIVYLSVIIEISPLILP